MNEPIKLTDRPTPETDASEYDGQIITSRLLVVKSSVARRLEQQRDAAVEALEHIEEYWNRDQNEKAMTDALWHMLETAHDAITAIKETK